MKHLSPAEIETIRVPEPKHDPFSLESLVAWLERQPGDKDYCYYDNGHCLLSQYFTAAGFKNVHMFTDCFWHGETRLRKDWGQDELLLSGKGTRFPKSFDEIASIGARTFGAALQRARAALASQKGNANG